MSIMRCALHDTQYDSDKFDICPVCETIEDIERTLAARDGRPTPQGDDVSAHGVQRRAGCANNATGRDRLSAS